MDIIRPVPITDAMLVYTDIPENDYSAYNAGTTYATGNVVIVTDTGIHKAYESLKDGNTGHYPPENASGADPWWLDRGKTNRWKAFDQVVQAQASQAGSMTWVLEPGLIDGVGVLNMDATSVRILSGNKSDELVTNGQDWTGASGTTPPTGWTAVTNGSALKADAFTIDSGWLKFTVNAGASSQGMSQTFGVTPGDVLQLVGKYKNTAGDIAQYAIYDISNSADIVAKTDLISSTSEASFHCIFTIPDGCSSIKMSFLGKASADIVWFDSITALKMFYDEETDLISTAGVSDWYTYFFNPIVRKTDVTARNMPPFYYPRVTVVVTYAGDTALCGEILLGTSLYIGALQYSPEFNLLDYSVPTEDAWGNLVITPRAIAKKLTISLRIPNSCLDEIARQLTICHTTPVLWLVMDNYSLFIAYGYYKDLSVVFSSNLYSLCALYVRGLT